MKLGQYEVPEIRLLDAMVDVKKILDKVRSTTEYVPNSDIALTLDYRGSLGGAFYRRLNSLTHYGLLEGRGKFRITELGESLSYPPDDKQKSKLYKEAFLNVPFWNKLYTKYGRNTPDSIWLDIKTTTGISSAEAQEVEKEILKWYRDDVAVISDIPDVETPDQKTFSSEPRRESSTMSQQLDAGAIDTLGKVIVNGLGYVDINDYDSLAIAKSYLNVVEKRLKDKKAPSQDSAHESPDIQQPIPPEG